ncbi:hypothetical protein JAAARDRAFT_192815 [Jaapia argillacea MUCL 33604]|uniref:Peptidase A1 domain-containing protein n=1 Tax=Jaapia argillacea MUCL 33604 TaxID=933084 RepID=A0A067PZJ7_9AGAM|nr:hypothetical protein JAAARDRAFT_192815 [Jaapia argillacea MUCL 33604]
MINLTTLFAFISLLDTATSVNFTNAYGRDYVVTVEFDGQPVQVQLDTGSSDLWVDPTGLNLTPFTNTGRNVTFLYGNSDITTVAEGPIFVGPVQLGDFKVDKQAFGSALGSNATLPSDNSFGVIGVAASAGSLINSVLKNTSYNGGTFLDNVFRMNPEEPNYITFMLSRDPVFGVTSGGIFTIGEVASEFAAVVKTPQRKVVSTTPRPRWATTMDGMIVNGKTYSGHSKFNSTFVSAGQTIAVLDSGTSTGLVPRFYADAMFKDLPGAVFNDSINRYLLPCDSKVNVSFVFGKDEYPINPIDIVDVLGISQTGEIICSGGFPVGDVDDLDIILGDVFLRNAYALFDYGNWATPGSNDPFMQILSVTNQAQAWNDFDAASTVLLNSMKVNVGTAGDDANDDQTGGGDW